MTTKYDTEIDRLRSNADAHREAEGTERRRAADIIESLQAERDAARAVIEEIRAASVRQEANWGGTHDALSAVHAVLRRVPADTEIALDEMVERAAKASFEPEGTTGDYTWAEMVREDPERADIWRKDARAVLLAAFGGLS